ncbi:hypothetical protein CVU76_00995 [Candidatus Dojkabacteria bacterium HGW-Dojkabacteria-1]|uniref:Uncharacterized protein n=1 Tax=Candidatus Dojkabacteria bacterium HGW-Dojkabacteria-1 TaxID=2013761 RepID=A0A2N2F309_9BACT|nr:MAG: hypothetical protein CVU76_00995 [Candidatus Dojkabacteria bacterium HGW-Dojkabacteria-1]
MKNFKLPKIKAGKIDFKYLLNYFLVILLTSFVLVCILIALPLTETVSSNVTYDLKTKSEMYWAKEYLLEIDNSDAREKNKQIDGIKSVLYRRLSKLGVEKVDMANYSENEKEYILIHVQSSLTQMFVDELIRSPFLLEVVTKNPDIDFEDPENPYAIYLAENYLPTGFTRESFRNIYITKLKNASNEYSYFALYKTWPWDSEWNDFMNLYKGQEVGVSIDGFVTPIQVPATEPILFALPVSTLEREEAELISILYNSGIVPFTYSLVDQQEVPIENVEADYIKLIQGIIIAVVVIYAYLLLIDKTEKKTLIVSALTTIITISIWIAYLKIAVIPVDIFLLAIEVIVMVAILRITTENTESRIIVTVLLALIASLVAILGTGYAKIFASNLFVLLILGNIAEQIARFYTFKVRKLLRL